MPTYLLDRNDKVEKLCVTLFVIYKDNIELFPLCQFVCLDSCINSKIYS